jgi:hypothetical protein
MKTKNIFRSVIFVIFLFALIGSLFSQMRLKDRYYIGSIGAGTYYETGVIYFYEQNSTHWTNYNDLKFNLNHQYLPNGLNWAYEEYTQGNVTKKIGAFLLDII